MTDNTTFSVTGIRPPDKDWKEMKAVYDACKKANVAMPEAVQEFYERGRLEKNLRKKPAKFDYKDPDMKGIEMNLTEHDFCRSYQVGPEMEDVYEIEVAKIPKDLTFIFIISY